jgi:ribosomal protein L11 methyltransferase
MAWVALELVVGSAHAEAVADALLELGAQSVSTEDAEAGTVSEVPQFAEPTLQEPQLWRQNRLTALIAPEIDAEALVGAAAVAAGLPSPPRARITRVEDDDWVRRTQSQFGPIRAGARLWVVPQWCEPPAAEDAIVLRLDPGLAFGTGSHPSTRLVLAWLERTVRGGEKILDYGCGSGILSLAALRLGAGDAIAVDLDPLALEACSANARLNGVSIRVLLPDALRMQGFDLVVANILAGPLIALAPELAARARPGGRLALSGILASQVPELRAAFEPFFALTAAQREDDWVLLEGSRR